LSLDEIAVLRARNIELEGINRLLTKETSELQQHKNDLDKAHKEMNKLLIEGQANKEEIQKMYEDGESKVEEISKLAVEV